MTIQVNGSNYQVNGIHPDGFMGGIFAGYNWRLQDDWLVGLEAGANWISNDDEGYVTGTGNSVINYVLKQEWEASIVGRVGKIIDDTWMPYALAGVTWTKQKGRYEGGGLPDWMSQWDDDTVAGFTVGAGVEYKITENFHTRLEYRYNNYQDAKFSHESSSVSGGRFTTNVRVQPGGSGGNKEFKSSVNYNSNVVTLGFIYRF